MLMYLDEAERAAAPERPTNVLAVVRFGAPTQNGRSPWLTTGTPNPPLPGGPTEELWPAAGSVSEIELEGASAAADGRFVFVSSEVPASEDVEAAAFAVYRRLLSGIEGAGYPHVLRVWNYVPGIHEACGGIDRYMSFCKGRSEAFAAHFGPIFERRLPAASAVGCPGDALVVHVLASKAPGRHVENPRQIAAYRYPERYGPKSPSFARATVTGTGAVLVSGTASIVGHESVFPGDPRRQTEETLRNIAAVLEVAGGQRLGSLRVYVRFPEQLETIRQTLRSRVGDGIPTAWLQAQVCRRELLVEIEATAHPQLG